MANKKDVFLCHTSVDKKKYVIPFAEELDEEDITYWIDKAEIKWGDNIIEKINEGLKISSYVIVFLSPNFFGEEWPEKELASALSMENKSGEVIVLPILIEDENTVFKQYPLLRSKKCVKWSDGIDSIVFKLKSRLGYIKIDRTKRKKTKNRQSLRMSVLEQDLLCELKAYSAMLPFAEKYTHQQQLNLSLYNQFARILMARYGIAIRDNERNKALSILNDRLISFNTIEIQEEEKSFYEEFPEDLEMIGESIKQVRNLVKKIFHLVESVQPVVGSAQRMVNLLNKFYVLCYGLFLPGQSPEIEQIKEMLALGENDKVEFKSTLIWDIRQEKQDKERKKSVAKTIAAFMNTKGGVLLIGVDDDGNPIGLGYDFQVMDKDKFERSIGQLISDMIGSEYHEYIYKSKFISIEGVEIYFLSVIKSSEPAFVIHKNSVEFFIRVRNMTPPLNVKDAIMYYKMHFLKKKEEKK